MQLTAHGQPLHTRALAVTLVQRADGKLAVHGSVVDVRKQGLVPVAGDLQGIGVIHDMRLDGCVDPGTATLETIAAQQPSVAFEPSALSRGESCRDPIAAVEALAGARLDAGFAKQVSAAIGGPRGCSHLLTLAHLVGSTAAWAIERDRALHGPTPSRAPGQRVFRRDVIVDGYQVADSTGRVELTLKLVDLHFAPAPPIARPMDRFATDHEIRAVLTIEFPGFTLAQITLADRQRNAVMFEPAVWRERSNVGADLIGQRFGFGGTAELIRRFEGYPDDRPILDALLMVAPALIQCAAALSEGWAAAYRTNPSVMAVAGITDSCYMWRRDGALARAREAEGGVSPPRP